MDTKTFIGKIVADRYEILSIAGSGGMGTVFRARQPDLGREVALKVLDPLFTPDTDSVKRFEREAKSLSLLSNVHIAGFLAYGMLDGTSPFIVMEYVDGESLAAILEREQSGLPVDRALHIAIQTAEALAYAHNSGIVHRDLKPANILLVNNPEPDFAKIVDFGLSHVDGNGERSEHLTKTGMLLGTPQYLSPEQCMGRKADARSDIYSLGCILYQMICGETPFNADNPIGIIHMHVSENASPLSKRCKRKLPAGLDLLVMTCLAKAPDERYQSMDELKNDLKKIASGLSPDVHSRLELSKKESSDRKKKLFAKILISAASASLVMLIGTCLFFSSDLGAPARCKQSISRDSSLKNVISWLNRSQQLRKEGKTKQADEIESNIAAGLKESDLNSFQSGKLKLVLACKFLKQNDLVNAETYALASVFDFCDARKQHKLNGHAEHIIDDSAVYLKKLSIKHNQRDLGEQTEAGDATRCKAELLIAFGLCILDRLNEAVLYSDDAASLIRKLRLSHQLDLDLANRTLLMVTAYDTKWDKKIPYTVRRPKETLDDLAALKLCVASNSPAEDAEERFFRRRKNVARGYIGAGDLKGARLSLEEMLTALDPSSGSGDYQWTRERLAVVRQLLGDPTLMNKILDEKKSMGPISTANWVAHAQVWAADYNGATKTLENALANLDRDAPGALEDEIVLYRTYADKCGDEGDSKGEERYLRRCLALMDSDTVSGKYNTIRFQVGHDLEKLLISQHRDPEAASVAEKTSMTGAENLSKQ